MSGGDGYALNMLTPVRHVATELDKAAPVGLSVGQLAGTYTHSIPGDLSRVRRHEGCGTDEDAVLLLIQRAIEALGRQVASDGDGGYVLARPFDKLRYERKSLHRIRDDHALLRDPFNPMIDGNFSENIRSFTSGDLDELRESMRDFGWLDHHPAVMDERGVVLVGHRRLAVAKELGITPSVVTVRLGDGDEADAKRFRIAIASNLGHKPFTPKDRAKIAKYLYEADWSQERIAEALNVSQSTIRDDLHELVGTTNSPRRGRPRKLSPELEEQVIAEHFEQGKSIKEIADKVMPGTKSNTPSPIRDVIKKEEGRREERAIRDAGQCKCPNCGDVHPASQDRP